MSYRTEPLSSVPQRLGLFFHDKLIVSLSKIAQKKFSSRLNDPGSLNSDALSEIIGFERELLLSQMQNYLATSEKSPWHLMNWLKKRCLPDEVKQWLTKRAYKDNFLSQKRFLESYLSNALVLGNKPGWRIKGELQQKGISVEHLENLDIDDLAILKTLFTRDTKLRKLPEEKLLARLQGRGFRYQDIVAAAKASHED